MGANTRQNQLGYALSCRANEGQGIALSCVGASAVANAVKAVGRAQRILAETDGPSLVFISEFITVELKEGERTALLLRVRPGQ